MALDEYASANACRKMTDIVFFVMNYLLPSTFLIGI
jgi:hypothetical protein